MGSWELFEHTADVGLRVRGVDLTDLFRAAAEGLLATIVSNRAEVQPLERESVDLAAAEPTELMAAWLNELIFRIETEHRLYSVFKVEVRDGGRRLEGIIEGEPMDRSRHVLDHEVKAATHHGLEVRGHHGAWLAEVILDI